MANPYDPAGVLILRYAHDHWRVKRADGSFVAQFPMHHFKTRTDVRNVLKLMATAFDHGVDVMLNNKHRKENT
jgi:hypothetical protein